MIVIIDPWILEEVKRMKNNGFVRLPIRALHDKRLTLSAVAVLAVVLDRADDQSAELSAAQIASATELSVRTVKTAIKLLEECEYIRLERRAGAPSVFTCADVLPPKKRGKKHSESATEDKDLNKYDFVYNKF